MITNVTGDLFALLPKKPGIFKIIPHVANDMCVMGSGFALGLIKRWPQVKQLNLSTHLGDTEFILINWNTVVCNMIAQHQTIRENSKPIRYEALVESMRSVRDYYDSISRHVAYQGMNVEIHAPKFGSLRAKGNWEFITELIEEIWKDIPVFIYDYKETK